MKYQRKVFYVNEFVDEKCGKNIGYFKLLQRENKIQIEMHTEKNYNFLGQKIYLLEKDKHAVNKVFFGTILMEKNDIIMQKNTDEIGEINGDIAGVIVEGEPQTVCGGTDDLEIRISDYFSGEREQELKVAEVQGAEITQMSEVEEGGNNEEEKEENEENEEIIQVEMEEAHDEAYEYRKIFSTRSNMYPFEDDEMESCVQISPADFSDFPKAYWRLGGNTFLLQGYYNYRHLILAEAGEVIYIGIPGQYHRRDKYLADMFGFKRFKGIHKKQPTLGDFGYWLKEIKKPQPTERWVDCGENAMPNQEME